jgi:hypothetical protein
MLPTPPVTVRFYRYSHGEGDLASIREQGLLKSKGHVDVALVNLLGVAERHSVWHRKHAPNFKAVAE